MEGCPHCGAAKRRKHGLARHGKQRYFCPGCRRTSRPTPGTKAYDEARKAEILRAYQERTSLRGLTRSFGVSRQTVTAWLKKSPTASTVEPDTGAAPAG